MHINSNAPIEALLEAISESLSIRAKQAKLDRLTLAKLTGLNRNTVSAALSGKDIKLSTLIRLTRSLGVSDWLPLLIETPASTPMEQLTGKSKSNEKASITRKNRPLKNSKPASRAIGRLEEKS
jgi:transcriptional regulator with XRE-family HTH domain